ncbi:uncharacterized protein Z520_02388 [Fonsecaea multimorphosa CBS 102226]|uniref:CENP-V/GFA domain-containing protein n=1 Tax=Fonsecaea multimorphosa CBS 102226 TaxID=1442371 RepID=A0A0D2KFI9_9EURO|nr:uncharacterized protein Z520_02388 [Fonsecaea multimorphosa CBS 102226]KIY02250.1 hypothetical protein Z520_02388 [Fonsecaea multimorphosa CBS 102226]OAL28898.1 hypothetical protein AYO22_02334 [Fonsecaea multimorphosa]
MHGSCNCGAVTVEAEIVNDGKPTGFACHCRNCKKSSGAGGCVVMFVPFPNVTFAGPITHYADKNTDSGHIVNRHFCAVCGSPIYGLAKESLPGLALVRTALFDEFATSPPRPAAEIYTKDRWVWDEPIQGAQQVPIAGERS